MADTRGDMVERVAEALWNAASVRAAGRPRLTKWTDESEATRDQWRHSARAAIEALREPTFAMRAAVSFETAEEYPAMIDAILKEGD